MADRPRLDRFIRLVLAQHRADQRWRRRKHQLGDDHLLTRQAVRRCWGIWWTLAGGAWSTTRSFRHGILVIRHVQADGSVRIAGRTWVPCDSGRVVTLHGWVLLWIPADEDRAYRVDAPGPHYRVAS